MTTNQLDTRLLAQADLLFLLGDLLAPMDPASLANLPTDHDLDQLAASSGLAGSTRADSGLRTIVRNLARDPSALLAEHAGLFDGGQLCPPNETAYIRRDKGAVLADITGFYRAFGFSPAPGRGEKADHVATELQFVAVLLVMLVRAEAAEATEHAEITRAALCAFAVDHLGQWLPSFTAHLEATATQPGWWGLAAALNEGWALVLSSLGIEPSAVVVPPNPDTTTELECGACHATEQ